jgi:hypothetical protein
MPIIDGGLEIRLYPTYIPPHLNAAAGAHQYFCAEDCRKRGHNDEVVSWTKRFFITYDADPSTDRQHRSNVRTNGLVRRRGKCS